MAIRKVSSKKSMLFVGPPDTGKSAVLGSLPGYQNALSMDLEDPLLVMELLKRPEFMDAVLLEVLPGEWLTIRRLDRLVKYLPALVKTIKNKNIFIAATIGSLQTLDLTDENLKLFNVYYFTSMSFFQIRETMPLADILTFGTLPKIYNSEKSVDRIKYLKTYVQDFLDLDMISRGQVRDLVPFHLFLPLAAETAGKKINYSSMAGDAGVDYKTVQNYFDLFILHQCGFYLECYKSQVRKVQTQARKFYFFDLGFQRALANKLEHVLVEHSSEFQHLFKAWCIREVFYLNLTQQVGLRLSYLETKDGVEVDLVIEKNNGSIELVIFISALKLLPKHLKHLRSLGKSFPLARKICVVSSLTVQKFEDVEVMPYQDFLVKNFVLL